MHCQLALSPTNRDVEGVHKMLCYEWANVNSEQ